jgi:hypothetical protein
MNVEEQFCSNCTYLIVSSPVDRKYLDCTKRNPPNLLVKMLSLEINHSCSSTRHIIFQSSQNLLLFLYTGPYTVLFLIRPYKLTLHKRKVFSFLTPLQRSSSLPSILPLPPTLPSTSDPYTSNHPYLNTGVHYVLIQRI